MTEEVLKNIYRIPVPLPGNPLKELNAYLIKGADRSILIDTGFRQDPCRQALFSALEELGVRRGEVEVLLTHLHSDHSGLAPEVAGERNIYVSAADRPHLDGASGRSRFWREADRRFNMEGFPQEAMSQVRRTNPARSMAPPEGGHYRSLLNGDALEVGGYTLKALDMPGHTPGQMCFYLEREGAMFLGDHVLFDITPNITAWPGTRDSLGDYLKSLDAVAAYEVRLPLPGHRGRGDLRARVKELKDHHDRRLYETLALVTAHPGEGAYELAGRMTWKIRAASWAEFPLAQKWFAVGECMAHLDRLLVLGQAQRTTEHGLYRYYAC